MADHLILGAPNWFEIFVPIIFFVLYGVGQLMAGKDAAKPQPVPRRRPKPEGGANLGEAQPPEPVKLEDTLRSEVEDFIRRVQGKEPLPEEPVVVKEVPQRQNIPERPRWSEPKPQQKVSRRKPDPLSEKARRLPEVVLLEDETATEQRQRVARRPSAENRGEQFSGRGSMKRQQLSGEVTLADARLQSQMESMPQQRLGSLEYRQELVVKATNTVAEDVVKLLRSPAGMKQLIIASEILRRPKF